MSIAVSTELKYVLLIVGLFFVAKYLQRFRLPGAVTCLGLGVGFGLGIGAFHNDPVIDVFAIFGIAVLFLFAGMEFDVEAARKDVRMLAGHIVVQAAAIAAVTLAVIHFLQQEWRPALLVALALMSPSAGFILDSLAKLKVNEKERLWIKSRAMATEIIALLILLFVLQSSSGVKLLLSLAVITGMIVVLPSIFRFFASFVLPHAPKTEFAFLLVVALICAAVTNKLGVYYLVGAFIVGVTEQRLRTKLPTLATGQTMQAIELFASFFIPFYFLKAGLSLSAEHFVTEALILGAVFLLTVGPFRIALVAAYQRLSGEQSFRHGWRLGVSLLPTLVFTIVIAEILSDRFGASPILCGGLVIYTLVNTVIPSFVLRTLPVEYEAPEIRETWRAEAVGVTTPSESSFAPPDAPGDVSL